MQKYFFQFIIYGIRLDPPGDTRMDFIEKIHNLQSHAREQFKLIEMDITPKEEDTKTALIQPFIDDVLGYRIKNLSEVKTEFNIGAGNLRIDYAILKDGVPTILIECKKCTDVLEKRDLNQLKTYYPNIKGAKSKFGILTNGIIYQFYTDIRDTNILDDDPFFEFNLLNMPDSAIIELEKFIKSADIDNARDRADELMKMKEIREDQLRKMKDIRAIIEKLFRSPPSEDFVKFIAKQAHVGFVNDKVIKEYSKLTTDAINEYISDRIRKTGEQATGPTTEELEPHNDHDDPRFLFWTALLERMKKRSNLFANISPQSSIWISTGAGKYGLSYQFVIHKHDVQVLFAINRAKEETKEIFIKLSTHEEEINSIFVGKLDWQLRPDLKSSQIVNYISIGGYLDEGKWTQIQDAMIDAMIHLERALRTHIDELRI